MIAMNKIITEMGFINKIVGGFKAGSTKKLDKKKYLSPEQYKKKQRKKDSDKFWNDRKQKTIMTPAVV